MLVISLVCCSLHLLSKAVMLKPVHPYHESYKSKDCTGGSIYFGAHPVDSLLYQNPDIFHDFYVFKCITSVVFTSGDRGHAGNVFRSFERGLEAAYAHMANISMDATAWEDTSASLGRYNVTKRFLKNSPNVQVLYLRLPDGRSDGSGYKTNDGDSLQKLYKAQIKSIDTIDNSATYTLKSLGVVIATLLKQKAPRHIRILDFRTPMPRYKEFDSEHSDHTVSARIVMDVIRMQKIDAEVLGYAGSFGRKLEATMNGTNVDFGVKLQTFFHYAKHDEYMCQSYEECLDKNGKGSPVDNPDDVRYVISWLKRQYYVL